MKTVTTREAQHHLSKVIAMVENGEDVVLTRRGKKIVKLVLFEEPSQQPVNFPDFRTLRDRLGVKACGGENEVLKMRDEEGR